MPGKSTQRIQGISLMNYYISMVTSLGTKPLDSERLASWIHKDFGMILGLCKLIFQVLLPTVATSFFLFIQRPDTDT